MFRQSGNQLSTVYKLDIQQTFFTSQQYPDLKAFMEKLVENCKNIIAIKKVA
jgi:hypothetical protein